jgi:hypothetical protein
MSLTTTETEVAALYEMLGSARELSQSPTPSIAGSMVKVVAVLTQLLRGADPLHFHDRALEWE